jgi:hypothetical protein
VVAVVIAGGGVGAWAVISSGQHGTKAGDDLSTRRVGHGGSRRSSSGLVSSGELADASTTGSSTSDVPVIGGRKPKATTPATAPSQTLSTKDLDQPTTEQQTFPHDPGKCGPDPANNGPYRTDGRYEITATVKLWSDASTSSTPLGRIDVDTFGLGGFGCPDGRGPFVQVLCKVEHRDPVVGPFGEDTTWERVSYDDVEGYVSDEWLDSKWDSDAFPLC